MYEGRGSLTFNDVPGNLLFQSPQYNNGTPLPGLGGLPGLDKIGGGTPSGGGLVIQLDGPATTALLQGQAVQAIADNPRLVQNATMAATKSNANRRETHQSSVESRNDCQLRCPAQF
jgi:hypothetical protein